METTAQRPKFVRWAVLLGIVIALNLFFVAARSLVVIEPKYEDYCPTTMQPAVTSEACVAQDGVWVTTSGAAVSKPTAEGYCDLYQKCQPRYDDARKEYEMYAFVFMVAVGVLALIVGVIPLGSSIVSSGLSYGGVIALLIAAGGYWDTAGNLIRLGMSVIALAALLFVGIKRFKD